MQAQDFGAAWSQDRPKERVRLCGQHAFFSDRRGHARGNTSTVTRRGHRGQGIAHRKSKRSGEPDLVVGCKLRIPTPRNTKIALTGSGCQEVSKRASSVIRWERAGNGFDVTRRGIAGIAPNSKRPDSPGRFAQAAIEYSRRTPPSRSIRRICTEPSSGPSGTRGTGTSRSIPRCGLAEL